MKRNIKYLLYWLKSIFSINKSERYKYKNICSKVWVNKQIKKQKWGVSYSVFDGEELLEASILSIRDSVDYINVVYQTKSWYGAPANKGLLPLLKSLEKKKLIDELIEYIPDPQICAGNQEKYKRQLGLNAAKNKNINYFMTMDCDEFYKKDELNEAKRSIIKNHIMYSYVNIVNYGSLPTFMHISPVVSYVQFFSHINKNSILKRNKKCICLCDPTRTLLIPFSFFQRNKQYFLSNIAMHHMTIYRKNVLKKWENSSCKLLHKNTLQTAKDFDENTVLVPDVFDLLPLSKKWNENN